jgi:hypothetical protein
MYEYASLLFQHLLQNCQSFFPPVAPYLTHAPFTLLSSNLRCNELVLPLFPIVVYVDDELHAIIVIGPNISSGQNKSGALHPICYAASEL